ncbi:MAG: Gfo/Idh/MocA family oxidoreductase [Bacteroidetes bacterium]|nr:Gfo/Idh/MocA family oxidoreductase [Bacteroidota bacterium]MBU1114013.1 Gfo/Idh/MocA family oxidoreductase [Bacteroidota bacterium]MBU1798787.1 Gfo/Idh/MocA family oxidoreductase [Bacteroidota bacterium]
MLKTENIKLAIIGAGRWGMNHVKTAASLLPHENIVVFDSNPETEQKIRQISDKIQYSSLPFFQHSNVDDFNAVIIATPAETHFEIAKKCMLAGKNVLVEKPITLVPEEAEELLNLSLSLNLKLMVGHVLLFHPAVLRIKDGIEKDEIGTLQYIYSNRLNLGAIRSEENALWSFAPHDISVIQYLVGDNPIEVQANGGAFVQEGIEDSTLTFLSYPNNVKAHIFVSWLHPFKEQRMVIIGDKGMYVFEDSLKTEKLKFYKKGFKEVDGVIEKFDADYEVINFEETMPLAEEQKHFYLSILNNTTPRTDGKHALEVLEILDKATKKLKAE